MSRTSLYVSLALMGFAAAAKAQPPATPQADPPRARESLGVGIEPQLVYKSNLLKLPAVQEELKLTDAQKAHLEKLEARRVLVAQQIYAEAQGVKDELAKGVDREAWASYRERMLAYARTLTREDEKPLLTALDRVQRVRLEQIQLRADGYLAFTLPEIPERLGLDEDQIEAIAAIVSLGGKHVHAATSGLHETIPNPRQATAEERRSIEESEKHRDSIGNTRKAVTSARQSVMEAIGKVLTRAQRAKYQNMLGPAFDLGLLHDVPPPGIAGPNPQELAR